MAKKKKTPSYLKPGGGLINGPGAAAAINDYRAAQQPPLPSGSYDPALDAQLGAAQRGFGDLEQDFYKQQGRGSVDYTLQQQDLVRGRDRGLADLGTSRDRGLQDYGLQLSRGNQDLDLNFNRGNQDLDLGLSRGNFDLDRELGRGTQDISQAFKRGNQDLDRQSDVLKRSYQTLASRQGQAINASGLSPAAQMLAASRRQENEAFDRQPLDMARTRLGEDTSQAQSRLGEDVGTSRDRLGQDTSISRGRLGEDTSIQRGRLGEDVSIGTGRLNQDYATQSGRLNEDTDLGLGGLALQYQRQGMDAQDALERARREAGQFGIDVEAQKQFQAAQAGYVAPSARSATKRKKK